MKTPSRTIRVVVDRIEGSRAVLIDDEEKDHQIAASALPKDGRAEGAVLDVPVEVDGTISWDRAVRNPEEEKRLRADAEERLKRLRARDPGGDVEL